MRNRFAPCAFKGRIKLRTRGRILAGLVNLDNVNQLKSRIARVRLDALSLDRWTVAVALLARRHTDNTKCSAAQLRWLLSSHVLPSSTQWISPH
jgi:hypothetical protein